MKTISLLFVLFTAVYSFTFAQTPKLIQRPNAGFEAMEQPEHIPLLFPPTSVTKQVLSYDVSSGNADGNYTKAFVKYYDKARR